MEAEQIERLPRELETFLTEFDDCFARREGREHLRRYTGGQLADLPGKTVEHLAEHGGVPPRTLQDFLATHTWDHERAADRLQQLVAERHHDEQGIGLIDDTGFPKRGDRTAGVARQWCGRSGKIDNCLISVALGYAAFDGRFRCTLDSELFLPRAWAEDPERCREAGLPPMATHRPKWRIALDLLQRAQSNGVQFRWLTFDEGYGNNTHFLQALQRMGQRYVAEVPTSFHGWLIEPTVLQKEHHARRKRGAPRRFPRLAAQSAKAKPVERLCRYSPPMRDQPWEDFHVKDGAKGPIVWRARAARFRISQRVEGASHAHTLPSAPHWLVMAENPHSGEVKYFVSNAPAGVPVETVLHVAFARWHIERCFQDEKSQLGLDAFECRRYTAIRRHFVLSTIAHLFLASHREKLAARGEKRPEPATAAPGDGHRPRRSERQATAATAGA
jgi:SRSO17 transposase